MYTEMERRRKFCRAFRQPSRPSTRRSGPRRAQNGSIDYAVDNLEKASHRAGEVGDHRASELANFANALAPALETVQLVAMCLGDLSHEQ
jgi:hypothetical protein